MTLTLKIPKLKSPGRSSAKIVPNALEVHTPRAVFLYIGHELVAVHLFNGPAVQQSRRALRWAADGLLDDRGFLLEALQQDGGDMAKFTNKETK